MSKRAFISRYLLIVKKLKQKPYSTVEEIESYLTNQFEYLQSMDDTLELAFSKRTLQRDLREIRNIFGVSIEYSRADKGYFIATSESDNMNFQRMMDAFDLFNSLNIAEDLTPFVHIEKHQPQGTESLYGLLHAIKNNQKILLTYEKFDDNTKTKKALEPYALKEFKNRWYLLARDTKQDVIKTYGLDRITDLEIHASKFSKKQNFDVAQMFKHCFGIITPDNQSPEDIILSFHPQQGKYVKSLPLHATQQIITDNAKELRVQLKLYVTFDFMMELLSYGDYVKVIQPQSLVAKIKEEYKSALKQY
jgi:predicted DNA-binding transcriptional regulator YafY